MRCLEFGSTKTLKINIFTNMIKACICINQPWRFRGNDECVVMYTKRYMNNRWVQKALHANHTRLHYPWATCRFDLHFFFLSFMSISTLQLMKFWFTKLSMYNLFFQKAKLLDFPLACICSSAIRGNWTDSPKSMLPIIKELISAGIRVWIFR